MEKPNEKQSELIVISPFSDMVINCHYPESNSEEIVMDIACGLGHLGLFDSVDVK